MRYRNSYCVLQSSVNRPVLCGSREENMPGLRGYVTPTAARRQRIQSVRRARVRRASRLGRMRQPVFAGTATIPYARNMNRANTNEWSETGRIMLNIKNSISKRVFREMQNFPPNTDTYESAFEHTFVSPNQGIQHINFANKSQILKMIEALTQTMGNNVGYYAANFGAGAEGFGASVSNQGPYLNIGRGSFRSQDVNFVFNRFYEKQQFQNTCSNTLEFVCQYFTRRADLQIVPGGGNSDYNQQLQTIYDPQTLLDLLNHISDSNGGGSDNPVPSAYIDDVLPTRFGTDISKYTGVKQYYRKVKEVRFKLKPGEQKDVILVMKGPHRIDLPLLRGRASFKFEIEQVVTCRANNVSANNSTLVSHGSGQYSCIRYGSLTGRFGGISIAPTKRIVNAPLTTVPNTNQAAINPETDANQMYAEAA